jgi:lipopolysaccharide export system protein LptA
VSDKEVLISSQNAKFDQKLGIISLNENVVLKFDNLIFKSDRMELFFKDTSNFTENFSNLIKIIAMGNVYFERDQEVIKSDLVSFFPKENKVKITGNVEVVKGKNIGFKSEILEINLKKDTVLN